MIVRNTFLIGIILFLVSLNAKAQMTLEYDTNLSDGTQVCLPLNGEVDVTVDWGDGNSDTYSSGSSDKYHTYDSNGIYTVTITGSVEHYGRRYADIPTSSLEYYGFEGLHSFNYEAAAKLIRVTSWDGLGLTDLSYAFYSARNLTMVPNSLPNTVTNMESMFDGAEAFNGAISSWDVSSVTNMAGMFFRASVFNQDIGSWDVSRVKDMGAMFFYAEAFNQDISSWDVSRVKTMEQMFYSARAFNQDISSWDVSYVTNMEFMFCGASAFNQDIGSWDVSYVTNMLGMFAMVTLSTENYDALLNGWAAQSVKTNVIFDGGNSQYSSNGANARAILINDYNWTITDSGETSDVGIETLKQKGISIYPNPTNGIVNFDFSNNNIQQIIISDIQGKTLIEQDEINRNTTIDLSSFDNGIYVVNIQTDKDMLMTNIIKK